MGNSWRPSAEEGSFPSQGRKRPEPRLDLQEQEETLCSGWHVHLSLLIQDLFALSQAPCGLAPGSAGPLCPDLRALPVREPDTMAATAEQRGPENERARPHGPERGPATLSCPNNSRKALHEQWAKPYGAPRPHGTYITAKRTCKILGQAPCCMYQGNGVLKSGKTTPARVEG